MERKYTGIILGKYDIGEADRIYSIFTLESGKIKARATGVKKAAAKLAGSLENFNLADIVIAKKQGIGRISSAIVESNFQSIKADLKKISAVYRSMATVERLTEGESRDEKIFRLILDFLESLDSKEMEEGLKIDILEQGFVIKFLDLLGYRLEVVICCECGARISPGGNYFEAGRGGIICKECSSKGRQAFFASDNTVKLLRLIFKNNLSGLSRIKASQDDIRQLKTIADSFIRWITG